MALKGYYSILIHILKDKTIMTYKNYEIVKKKKKTNYLNR